jgi:photosystem II stability/assembly factor-like uncharacterized protein
MSMLRATVVPVILVGILQLPSCSRQVAPAPAGGVYLSASAGAGFEQAVDIIDQPGKYIASFSLFDLFRLQRMPSSIYVAAGNAGIVLSEDDGQTWRVISTPLANTFDIVVLDNGVLVASGSDGDGQGFVIRSLDEGKSWQTVLTIPVPIDQSGFQVIQGVPTVASVVLSLERDPFDGDRLWAGSSLGSLFVGEQSAKVWRNVLTIKSSSFDPQNQQTGVAIHKLILSPHTPNELLVVTQGQKLLRVRGQQQEEIKVPQFIDTPPPFGTSLGSKKILDASYVPGFPEALLLGVEDGAVVTRDGGGSWLQLPVPVEPSQKFISVTVAVSPTNNNRLLVAVHDVIYRSEDGGNTWNTFALGLANQIVSRISINPSNAAKVLLITSQAEI